MIDDTMSRKTGGMALRNLLKLKLSPELNVEHGSKHKGVVERIDGIACERRLARRAAPWCDRLRARRSDLLFTGRVLSITHISG